MSKKTDWNRIKLDATFYKLQDERPDNSVTVDEKIKCTDCTDFKYLFYIHL